MSRAGGRATLRSMGTPHLTPLDATFLELEDADPGAHMHIGALMVFAPDAGRRPPYMEDVLVHVDERLEALPRFRMRLSTPRVGRLRWPRWVEDDDFDLHAHVRRAALPLPGGETELLEWAQDFYSHRLDRRRPLWEIVVVDGLEDGGWALAFKAHHCLVDGMGAVALTSLLLDGDAPPAAAPARLQTGAVSTLAHAGADVVLHPAHVRRGLANARSLAELIVRDELLPAPGWSLHAPLGKQRRLATLDVPLDDLRAIRSAHGGTINDAVLALVAGGLRRLLLERGEKLPVRGVRAMVPVNLRAADDASTVGNHVSSLFVELPLDEPDPAARHRAVCAAARRRKDAGQAGAGEIAVELGGLAPPVVHAALARALFGPRLFNLTVTNVRGSAVPQYVLGCRMERAIPLVPLASGHAIGVAALSYAGDVCIGVQADRVAVPDIANVVAGMRDELDVLLAVTQPRSQPTAAG